MQKTLTLIFLILLTFQVFSVDESTPGIVQISLLYVIDGDTIKAVLLSDEQEIDISIRLYGIDCPEKKQTYGTEITIALTTFLNAEPFLLMSFIEKDFYGRTIALIYTSEGICINEWLVEHGYAWVYKKYCAEPFEIKWLRLQENAKNRKAGLWIDSNVIPPWEYRKEQKNKSNHNE